MRIAAKTALLGVVVLVCAVLVLRGSMPQVSSGTWAPTGNLTEPRQNAAAALLADGRILITGGDASGSSLVSADLFNTDGTISPAAPMSVARSKHVSVTLQDGRVLVAGGTVPGGGTTNAAEIYDPIADTWTSLAGGMIEARSAATAALLPDGRVVIAGGQNGSVVSSTIEVFDPAVDGFSFAGVLSSPRVQHAAVVLADGRVMIIGGFNGTIPVSSTDIFDPIAGSVALGPSLVVPRFGHSATTLLNGQVLVAGGNNGSPDPASMDLASAEIFNPSAGAFTLSGSALATPREGQLAFLLPHNNHVLLTGGKSAGVSVASSELFSPWQGTFAGTGSLTTARSNAVGSTMQQDGLLLVAGGGDANATALASTELHGFPTVKTDLPDYAPGTVVTITGSGWQPGETVTLSLVESPLVDTHPTLTAVADASGNILNNQFSPDIHDVNIRFYLTATGQSSGRSAQTTFTDAININSATLQISNSVSCSSSVSTFAQGDTPVACVTVTGINGSGAAGSFFVVWFNPPTTAQRTTTETVPSTVPSLITDSFATTGSTSTGTWTVQVCKNTTCGGSGNMLASATFTLKGATSTSVSLTAGANPSTYGSSLTFRATVSSGSGTPAGNVSFFDGGTCAAPGALLAGPTALNGSGQASFTTSTLSATAHTILACYAGNATFGASGGTVSQTVNGKTLTVTGITANSKVYDGNASATLNTSGATLVGVVSGDSVTLSTAGASGAFIDKNVGTAKAVTISGLTISGTNAANYTLTQPAATADIKTAPLTATLTAADKPYDGTNTEPNASMSCSVATVLTGETVNCAASSGTFNTKDVATANQVTATVTIGGGSAGNYTLGAAGTSTNSTSASGTSHITAVTLTASVIGNPTRPYNGNDTATLTAGNFSLTGLVTGETISVTKTTGTYNSKDVVSASTVTASLAAGDFTAGAGTLLTNYVLPTTASGAGHITAVTLTASIIGDPTRPYNGNDTATLTAGNFSLTGLVTGETINVTKTAGTYNSKDVVSANTVNASLAAGDFTAGASTLLTNYVLPTTAGGAGHITAVALTASIIGNPTRPYNGNTTATLTAANFSLAGLVGVETISVTQTAGTYNTKDVVSANMVTASLAAGDFTAGGGTLLTNYVLPATASGAGHITAVTLTASIIGDPTRPYNGNTNATLTAGNFSLTGLVTGETINVTKTAGTYNSKDVVSASTVTASLAAGDFTAGTATLTNYVLPTSASGAGHITAVTLTASIIGNPTRPYNGNTSATLTAANFSLAGLVSGETISVTQTAGTYNSKDAATANTVTASLAVGDFTAGTATLTNYVLPTSASGAGHITAVTLTASIIGNPTRPYNGNTSATLTAANFSLAGLVSGETISVTQTAGTYNTKDVVSADMVTASLAAGDFTAGGGTLLTNYVLPTTASGTGHITAVTLTASIINDPTRPYNGNTNATLTAGNFSLTGLVTGETINVTKTAGTYNSKDVVSASTVTASLAAGDFTAGTATLTNYVLPATASGAGHITAVTLTASIIGDPTRPYNGNTNATLTAGNFSLTGLVTGETINVTKTAGTYNSKDVVSASTVTASLAAGDFTAGTAMLTNYVLPTTASGAGHITAVTLTASIVGDPTRPYNGNMNAILTGANFSLAGLVGGDTISVTQTVGTYNSKDVATANTVTASLAAGDFTAGTAMLTNYVLPTSASGAGHITAVTLTASIIGDPTRPYNGNTNAILTAANFSLAGLVSGDTITVTQTSGNYNSKDVATANTVTASLSAGDFTAGTAMLTNYVLPTSASGAGHITAVTLTASIIGDPTRPYNGNSNATLAAANFSLAGLVSGDTITVTQTAGNYNSKDVATANTVTASLSAGDFTAGMGTMLTNYVLPTTASGAGHITAVTLTASIIGDPTRPYNGNSNATLAAANFSLAGLVSGDTITVTQTAGNYNSKDVATANTVTASLSAGDFTAGMGTMLTNYVLPTTASGAGHITAVTLTTSIIGDPTRPYNGNSNATLAAANFSLAGLVGGDTITITQTAGNYNSKDVATANTVNASLSAGDFTAGASTMVSNYNLPTSASGPGHITAVTLTASIIGDPTRPYNGNTNAILTAANFSLSGLVSGDMISVTQTAGNYNTKDVATASSVTASLSAGDFTAGASTMVSNYNLPTSASGPGHITAVTLTASIIGDPTRPYNGNTNAILTAANFSLTGLVAGDAISVTQTAGTYNSKDVATANTVTATLAPGDFMAGGTTMVTDYNLPTSASGPGHIGKTNATIDVTPYSLNYDGGPHTAAATAKGVLNESLSGLDVSGTTHTNAGDYPSDPWTFTDVTGNYNNDSGMVHDHINKTTPTVGVTFTPNSITYDANAHVASATVTGVSGTLAIPANGNLTISYKKNAVVFAGTPTEAASYTASAHFASSNSNYNDADSTIDASLTINKANTGTTVASTPNPSTVGQSITFKAVVSNTQTSPVPTGSVQFKIDNSNFGAPVLLSGGMASVSTSSLTAGNHVVVATYLPSDGNFNNSSGTLSGGQNVQYSFTGFFAPIDNSPILNSVKAGQTIPVKWQLKDVSGNLISDLSSLAANGLVSGPIACNATDLTLPVEETLASPGATVFRFDGTQFIYNWQTLKNYTGCRLLQVTLSDGTQHFAKFQFK